MPRIWGCPSHASWVSCARASRFASSSALKSATPFTVMPIIPIGRHDALAPTLGRSGSESADRLPLDRIRVAVVRVGGVARRDREASRRRRDREGVPRDHEPSPAYGEAHLPGPAHAPCDDCLLAQVERRAVDPGAVVGGAPGPARPAPAGVHVTAFRRRRHVPVTEREPGHVGRGGCGARLEGQWCHSRRGEGEQNDGGSSEPACERPAGRAARGLRARSAHGYDLDVVRR